MSDIIDSYDRETVDKSYDGYDIAIEEYRGLVNELFGIVLDRLQKAEQELLKLKLEVKERDQRDQLEKLAKLKGSK